MRRSLFAVLVVAAALSATPARAALFTVNNLGDAPDATPGDGICATAGAVCTFRAAIGEANALAGIDNIGFSVAGTINIAAPLVVSDRVFINAAGAPGYAGAPVVIVDGGGAVAIGFDFAAGGGASQLDGFEIRGFTDAAVVLNTGGVMMMRNYIGAITGGTPNGTGVRVNATAPGSQIGATPAGFGNVISTNLTGIQINGASGTRVFDNRIGTNPAGTAAMPNGLGIGVTGATLAYIGDAGLGNVISGNTLDGIQITGTDITVAGNMIGTDVTGLVAIPNAGVGIQVGAATRTLIGTDTARNVIGGNGGAGILNMGTQTTVRNNYIGIGSDGSTAVPNQWGMVEMGTSTAIGTSAVGNVISGNSTEGLQVNAASVSATIRNNRIGVNAAGTAAVPNGANGIVGVAPSNTMIGEGNVISGNGASGIAGDFTNSQIIGNLIGLNAAGTAAIPNTLHGIHLSAGTGTRIGVAGAANAISGNTLAGILLDNTVTGVIIEANRIGTDATGSVAVPNSVGVDIFNVANVTLIENVVSGNTTAGVDVRGTSSGVTMTLNIVGRNSTNIMPVPNSTVGIVVRDTASATIGAVGAGNIVASNNAPNGGIAVANSGTALIRANSIFDNLNLGIDLMADLVTPNDPLDADAGPNTLQNYPVIVSTVSGTAASYIGGTLNSTPLTTFTLDFFTNSVPGGSDPAEGETYIGSMDVTTDALGNASFTFAGPPVAVGTSVTSTATAATGTSEFSVEGIIAPLAVIQFSSATYSATEGAVAAATITVTRTGDLTATSTVNYATSTGLSGTLTFAPGVGAQTFPVPIANDTTDEPDEIVTLTLSAPTIAELGVPSTATLTITDDDPLPSVTINDVSLAEGNAGAVAFNFTVTLSNPSASNITVDYATANGTATAGSDYTAAAGTLMIPAGSLSGTIPVSVLGDTVLEGDETFFVNLTNPVNAAITDNQGLGTILNDEAAPANADVGITGSTVFTQAQTTFTLTVTNFGPAVATGVTVTDTIPLETTLISVTTTAGSCTTGSPIVCSIGTLAVGGTATITVVVTSPTDRATSLNNIATVTANEPDPNPANNTTTTPVQIPTLSEWMLMLLAVALVGVAVLKLRT